MQCLGPNKIESNVQSSKIENKRKQQNYSLGCLYTKLNVTEKITHKTVKTVH